MNRPQLEITPGFYFALSVAVLLLPLKWLLAWLAAAFLHEMGHYMALCIFGNSVVKLTLNTNGALMHTQEIQGWRGGLCALSGPLSGLLLLLLLHVAPRLALCGLVQSVYNLLPIYPLDGGQALRCLLGRGSKKARTIQTITEYAVLAILLIASVYAMISLGLGPLPVFVVLTLSFRNRKIKFPCKGWLKGVQ